MNIIKGNKMNTQGRFIVNLIFCLLIIAVLTNGCDLTPTPPKPSISVGEKGIIDCGGSMCCIATSEEAWREYRKTIRAKDIHGTANLMMAGKLFTVDRGTKALVIDYNPGTALSKIRILEGKGEGLAGWVPFEHITKETQTQKKNGNIKTR